MLGLVIVLVAFALATSGIKLPSYFHKCSINDPHLGQCISDAANLVIPKLVKGNKDFDLPPLSLFKIPDVHSPSNSSFTFNLVQVSAGYLEDARYVFSNLNRTTIADNGTVYFPQLNVYGYYDIDGKVGDLSVSGSGLAYIAFSDVFCNLLWHLEKIQRNGTDYLQTKDLKVTYDVKGAQYSLAGLFVAGELLEEDANEYLNKNWKILAKVIAPSVMYGLRDVALTIAKAFTAKVPLQEIFYY